MKNLLILGAKSDIAKAIAVEYAGHGYHLILAGREIEELNTFAEELRLKYLISVELKHFDALDFISNNSFVDNLTAKPNGVICCVGYLGSQEFAENNTEELLNILNTNFIGCVTILSHLANYFEEAKEGFIIGISSVAGERGRKSNYFYGSAKAGFTQFLSGLRARLHSKNIHVLTVKPGFVYTKMTSHLDLPKSLSLSPDALAKKVFKAHKNKKNNVYIKWVWKYIMCIIRLIPEFIFKKLNL
jgi:decaprenylphospho-beta-D-erythro-pentofuranosid-2-ulose 2-reductase